MDEKRLYVYNFPFGVEEEEIEKEFQRYGKVNSVQIIKDA